MFRLATCKDLVMLRGRHKHLDEALRIATHKNLTEYYPRNNQLDELLSHDFVWGLKQMGALFCADKISTVPAHTLLEAGAGLNTFFDAHFGEGRRYWMIDRAGFYDSEFFRKSMMARKRTTFVDGLLGQFSKQLPSNFFDLVFSISVLEHISFERLRLVFDDIYRVLKPGGFSVHTIDVNPHSPAAQSNDLIKIVEDAGLEFENVPSELDWNVGRLRDPVLLEPLRIVYEYYYKKSLKDWPDDPYLACYHFGSILLSVYKPRMTARVENLKKADLRQQIYDHCSSIEEITARETSAGSLNKISEIRNDFQITDHFTRIQLLLKQDSTLIYSDEKIRNFLYKTFPVNPRIPKIIGGIPCDTLQPLPCSLDQSFIDKLLASDCPITVSEFKPDLALYRGFLEQNAPFYNTRFGDNPLHGREYFFKKTLEHFITFYLIGQCGARDIMDIGSAGHQYAGIIRRAYPGKRVWVQDLCFAEEIRALGEDFFQIGGSAASLPLGDASIDFVTFHCSIEHFEKDADIECLLEIERILRPGGHAVIVPLYTHDPYTLVVNPVSGPFLNEDFITDVILPELRQDRNAKAIYTNGMVSRFARMHCPDTLTGRLLSKLTQFRFEFCTIEIPDEFYHGEIISDRYFRGAYQRFIPHPKRCFLKLIKQ